MKIKQLAIAIFFAFMVLIPPTYASIRPSWLVELPEVMCIENKVWLLWKSVDFAIKVTGIFCTLTKDLV